MAGRSKGVVTKGAGGIVRPMVAAVAAAIGMVCAPAAEAQTPTVGSLEAVRDGETEVLLARVAAGGAVVGFALSCLADGGGSNSCTARAWKFNLQHRLCNRHGLQVTVAHYPPATSKWNPIEHRLFGEISKNWASRPLDSFETILKYLRTTRTSTGLRVRAHLVPASRSPTSKCESCTSRRTASCPSGTTPSNPCDKKRNLFCADP